MSRDLAPGWRFFTVLAVGLVAAAIALPLAGIDTSRPTVHVASAIVFLVVGGYALSRTQQGRPMHTLVGGLLVLGASALSFLAAFLPAAPTQLSWSLALTGAISAVALDLVMRRFADDLEALRGAGP